MERYGLIGEKLSHSLSPQIHQQLGDYKYDLIPIASEDLDAFFAEKNFAGLNITIPYKKEVMKYCRYIEPQAEAIGCINTIRREKDGSLSGYNTDYYGFRYLLESRKVPVKGKKALILGNGGACLTVKQVLKDLEAASITVISRRGPDNYTNLERHKDAELIVNTTPVGMYPNNGQAALSLKEFPCCKAAVDLIYNPFRTRFLLDAEELGMQAVNGLPMLAAQAFRASEIFQDKKLEPALLEKVIRNMEDSFLNIVLVGMPGCGKSTQGRQLAEYLGRPFRDTDAVVVEEAGCPVTEIFEKEGETAFRDRETKAAYDCTQNLGQVLATGGGLCLRKENRDLLRQNGYVIHLTRPVEKLSRKNRPLSSDEDKLKAMEKIRIPLYKSCCDVEVEVAEGKEETLQRILKAWEERK